MTARWPATTSSTAQTDPVFRRGRLSRQAVRRGGWPDRWRVETPAWAGPRTSTVSPDSTPGVTGFAGGRPKPQRVVAYWPALLDRAEVEEATTDFSRVCFDGSLELWQHVHNVLGAMQGAAEPLELDGRLAASHSA